MGTTAASAAAAGKTLNDGQASSAAKTAAGSALAQRDHGFRKGQKVIGLGRFGATWTERPSGVVTQVRRGWVRVDWDGCNVEDDMLPEWLDHA